MILTSPAEMVLCWRNLLSTVWGMSFYFQLLRDSRSC